MSTIFWAGDSTVKQNSIATYPQTGIGQMFDRFVKLGEVVVENHAENGRSTKSFLDEGRLVPIYDRMRKGDFLFIQFGHNDEKTSDPERYAAPGGEYDKNLERFVNAARNKGAIPVIISPVTRRLFRQPGQAWGHGPYAAACRETAKRLDVAFIDLTAMSEQLVDARGVDACEHLYMNLPAGKYANYPEGQVDNTHLQPEGAMTFGALIAQGLYELGGAYRALLCDEFEAWYLKQTRKEEA